MFLLPGEENLSDAAALQAALERGLAQTFHLPPAVNRVTRVGAGPGWERLAIDLSGGQLGPDAPPALPAEVRERSAPFAVGQLSVVARPLRWGGAASVEVDLAARGARLAIVRDARAVRWLALAGVDQATVRVNVGAGQLQALVTDVAQRVGRAHGLTVKEAHLDLTQPGPEVLAMVVRISAQKSLLRGTVVVSGRARVTAELEVRLSGLMCQGEGMVGGIAARALQPHLRRWEDRPLPVVGHALGNVRVESVTLELGPGQSLRLAAQLKSAGRD